jgi:hypothetical protein
MLSTVAIVCLVLATFFIIAGAFKLILFIISECLSIRGNSLTTTTTTSSEHCGNVSTNTLKLMEEGLAAPTVTTPIIGHSAPYRFQTPPCYLPAAFKSTTPITITSSTLTPTPEKAPIPTIMVSNSTSFHSLASLEALSLGTYSHKHSHDHVCSTTLHEDFPRRPLGSRSSKSPRTSCSQFRTPLVQLQLHPNTTITNTRQVLVTTATLRNMRATPPSELMTAMAMRKPVSRTRVSKRPSMALPYITEEQEASKFATNTKKVPLASRPNGVLPASKALGQGMDFFDVSDSFFHIVTTETETDSSPSFLRWP